MNTKKRADLAPVTSILLPRDGLHVSTPPSARGSRFRHSKTDGPMKLVGVIPKKSSKG
jgi:hypothetical protein